MPQLDFFLTQDDELEVVDWILSRSAWLIPDRDFATSSCEEVRARDAFLRIKGKARLFFILHDSYYRIPLELRRYGSGPKQGEYFIVQRSGGPALSFLCLPPFVRDGEQYLPPGMIAYYKTYWNPDRGLNESTPPELVVFYDQLSRVIRQNGQPVRMGPRTLWVGKHARAERAAGMKLVGVDS